MLSTAMQVLSKEEFSATLPLPVEEFVDGLAARLAPGLGSYRIPVASGRKTALAKLLARILPQGPEMVVWINDWSVWQSGEHLDLFYIPAVPWGRAPADRGASSRLSWRERQTRIHQRC